MDYSTFRRKPEINEYEQKLRQLEQNLKGLASSNENEDLVKQRSISRENNSDTMSRRLTRIEERLQRFELRQDEYENRVKKVVSQVCQEIDSAPWNQTIEQFHSSVEAKLLLIEDKIVFIQKDIETRLQREIKAITNSLSENMKKNGADQDVFGPLFEMIKKCIDSQQQMVDEFRQFKSSVRIQIGDENSPPGLLSRITPLKDKQSRATIHHQERPVFKTFENEVDIISDTMKSQSNNRKSYNELKEQDFDNIRRPSVRTQTVKKDDIVDWGKNVYGGTYTERNRYSVAKHQIDTGIATTYQEIKDRIMKEDDNKSLVKKSLEKFQRNKSKTKI